MPVLLRRTADRNDSPSWQPARRTANEIASLAMTLSLGCPLAVQRIRSAAGQANIAGEFGMLLFSEDLFVTTTDSTDFTDC